jgi:hypothetical protein
MQEHQRRAKQRFPIQLPVVIKNTPTEIHGVSRDVSAAGIFFYTTGDEVLKESEPIEFMMILPLGTAESIHIVCVGTVVRLEEDEDAKTGVAATIDHHDFG